MAETETQQLADTTDRLLEFIGAGDVTQAQLLSTQLDEASTERLFEELSPTSVQWLLDAVGDQAFAELLTSLEDQQAATVLESLTVGRAADLLEEIDPDDATDIFNEVDPEIGDNILIEMEPDEAAEIRDLMAYSADTAGGIMTPAFVAIAPSLSADQAIRALRKVAEEAETINYVYVTDRDDHLLGVLSLHRLVLVPPNTSVRDIMFEETISVPADTDQEEVAKLLLDNDLLAIPVLDHENHLLGIITVDDIAEVLELEATEDIERLGGSAPLREPYLLASPRYLYRKRFIWLVVLFVAQFATVSIIANFDNLLEQVTVLSFFIPILIGTGGNIGSQTVSTLIRALAVGEVSPRNAARVLSKEVSTGLLLGLSMAVLMFIRAIVTNGSSTDIAITVAIAVFAISVWAATIGAILPLILTRLRVDPAVVSAPLISSVVDATGLFIYFTVAGMMLDIS